MSIVYSGDNITFPDGTSLSTGTVGSKNRIINGDMRIDQRNNGASNTVGTGTWTLDRWHSENSAASKYSVQRSTDVPSGQGFSNSMVITSLAATTPGSSDAYLMRHHVEGLNFADFAWGTANAKPATFSFWVKSSVTGTYGGAFRNNDNNRSYLYQYTINSANTWEYKTITVPGDTSGTWYTDTNRGVTVYFGLSTGSTINPYGYTGAWINGNYQTITSQTNFLGTNGATMYITGVQFEKGSSATSFDFRHYGLELLLCQRYFVAFGAPNLNQYVHLGTGSLYNSSAVNLAVALPATMRTTPSLTKLVNGSSVWLQVYVGASGVNSNGTPETGEYLSPGSNTLRIYVPSSYSGGTAGQGTWCQVMNGAQLQFSAEL